MRQQNLLADDLLFERAMLGTKKKETEEMTEKMMLSMALIGGALFMGCSQHNPLIDEKSISVTSIQGIERIVQPTGSELDVVCPTGICRFELATNTPKTITVSMYYAKEQPFKKLEGIDVSRQSDDAIRRLTPYQFEVTLQGDAKQHEIQVVDYFRN